jgi:hypothetical protein
LLSGLKEFPRVVAVETLNLIGACKILHRLLGVSSTSAALGKTPKPTSTAIKNDSGGRTTSDLRKILLIIKRKRLDVVFTTVKEVVTGD